jgi:GT2 family glycosyltransferase
MMSKIFHTCQIETKWTLWFDDDSYPVRSDWLENLALAMEAFHDVDMFGSHMCIDVNDRLEDFLSCAKWYNQKPFVQYNGRKVVDFIAGGFWALKTKWIYQLDWPDKRIIHLEDDYVFGEALRQNGAKIMNFKSGVEINAAKRRCGDGTPNSY